MSKVSGGIAELNTKVVTGKVRFSYVYVFQPRPTDNPEEASKYSVSILISKKDIKTINAIKAAIKAAEQKGIETKWGGRLPSNIKKPLRDGDVERPDDEAYVGCYFINANSTTKPGVVDENLEPILDPNEFYSGCYGRASITFYPFSVAGNKGIAAGLNNLQKLADGEYLGGRTTPEADFGENNDYEDHFGDGDYGYDYEDYNYSEPATHKPKVETRVTRRAATSADAPKRKRRADYDDEEYY